MATDCLTAVVASGGLLVVAAAAAIEVQKKRKKRKIWTKQWILRRPVAGAFSGLIKDLFTTDEISYKNFLRMDAGAVEELFSRIEVKLTKQSTCLVNFIVQHSYGKQVNLREEPTFFCFNILCNLLPQFWLQCHHENPTV